MFFLFIFWPILIVISIVFWLQETLFAKLILQYVGKFFFMKVVFILSFVVWFQGEKGQKGPPGESCKGSPSTGEGVEEVFQGDKGDRGMKVSGSAP